MLPGIVDWSMRSPLNITGALSVRKWVVESGLGGIRMRTGGLERYKHCDSARLESETLTDSERDLGVMEGERCYVSCVGSSAVGGEGGGACDSIADRSSCATSDLLPSHGESASPANAACSALPNLPPVAWTSAPFPSSSCTTVS